MAELMRSPLVEWRIARQVRDKWVYHTEGAQSVFSEPTAKKIIKQLKGTWELRHINRDKEQ